MITVYSKDNCPRCDLAIKVLQNNNIPHEVMKLDLDYTREDLLEAFPSTRMLPVIYDDGYGLVQLQNLESHFEHY